MHKMIQNQVKISVRSLVEFILRSGDIDNRRSVGAEYDAMQLGSRLHRKIQSSMDAQYHAEVSLKHKAYFGDVELFIEGRADGIIYRDNGPLIDEIKVVRLDLHRLEEPVRVHLAQAVCYGYMCAYELIESGKRADEVELCVTYCHPETEQIKQFKRSYSYDDIKAEFESYVKEYGKWAQLLFCHRSARTDSISRLNFPYEYRPGQRSLVITAYKSLINDEQLFIQAPTGIGKTISVLFPAIQAVGQGGADKIFYLTAKSVAAGPAVDGMHIMRRHGLKASFISLVSKEKLCLCAEMDCNPVHCKYAKGHFDRVNDAVFAIISNESEITREVIIEYAMRYSVCPFEMSLDASYWVDVIICDYNYLFDPHVRLARFFSQGDAGDYYFLVDEAHNLPERARDMYSATIVKEDLLEAKEYFKSFPSVIRRLDSCSRSLLILKRECDSWKEITDTSQAGVIAGKLGLLYEEIDRLLEKHPDWRMPKEALKLYFEARDFVDVFEIIDEHYRIYMEHSEDGKFALHLFCVNPARRLQECCALGLSTIFFSATLLPIDYYKRLLCEDLLTKAVYVNSPFDKKRRIIAIADDVSTRYVRRTPGEYANIASYIDKITAARKGNYLVFFPSYALRDAIERLMKKQEDCFEYVRQESKMTEQMREEFLESFRGSKRPVVGLCVMGGIFSEGIDLKGDAVIGVIVVGTGLAQVCARQEVLRRYYEDVGLNGFSYAYLYPGMNKVLQAVGRLIRTSDDYGVAALLDERFLRGDHSEQFPIEWFPYRRMQLTSCDEVVGGFWRAFDMENDTKES